MTPSNQIFLQLRQTIPCLVTYSSLYSSLYSTLIPSKATSRGLPPFKILQREKMRRIHETLGKGKFG